MELYRNSVVFLLILAPLMFENEEGSSGRDSVYRNQFVLSNDVRRKMR